MSEAGVPIKESRVSKPRRATKDPLAERRREAFSAAIRSHGLSPIELARRAELANANSFYNFKAGRSQGLSAETIRKIAPHLPHADLGVLMGISSGDTGGAVHDDNGRTPNGGSDRKSAALAQLTKSVQEMRSGLDTFKDAIAACLQHVVEIENRLADLEK